MSIQFTREQMTPAKLREVHARLVAGERATLVFRPEHLEEARRILAAMPARYRAQIAIECGRSFDEELTDEILNRIPNAVSYIHRSLQQEGWKGLGNLADFEAKCQRLGFVVRRARNDRNQLRVEVTL